MFPLLNFAEAPRMVRLLNLFSPVSIRQGYALADARHEDGVIS